MLCDPHDVADDVGVLAVTAVVLKLPHGSPDEHGGLEEAARQQVVDSEHMSLIGCLQTVPTVVTAVHNGVEAEFAPLDH